MELVVWLLGIMTTILLAFLAWLGTAIVEIKTSVAVINQKLSSGDKKHDDFESRIKKLEDKVWEIQSHLT